MKRVVGVGLDEKTGTPVVVLKGAGDDANRILAEGQVAGTPVVCDGQLVSELYRTPLDVPVGRELFPVMAVLLAHVLHVDQVCKGKQA